MSDLRSRAEALLHRPFPGGERESGDPTNALIARYLAGGPWDDAEQLEQLSLSLMIAQSASAEQTGDVQAYHQEAAQVLQEIQDEVSDSI